MQAPHMLAWLGGKQKLVQKAKARQRAHAAAACGSGGSGAFVLPASKAALAPRPVKRHASSDSEQDTPQAAQAAMPAPGAQRGGRPPLPPAPANSKPCQLRLKRVKASLDLLALEMPAWQPAAGAAGGGSEGSAGGGGGGGGMEGGEAAEGSTAEHPPAAAMEVEVA